MNSLSKIPVIQQKNNRKTPLPIAYDKETLENMNDCYLLLKNLDREIITIHNNKSNTLPILHRQKHTYKTKLKQIETAKISFPTLSKNK